MLTLRNVSRIYRAADVQTAALKDISLDIDAGELIAVTGPSGCGKSTLLNILGMLDVPSAGEYQFFGERVHGRSEDALALLRRRGIAFIRRLAPAVPRSRDISCGSSRSRCCGRPWLRYP